MKKILQALCAVVLFSAQVQAQTFPAPTVSGLTVDTPQHAATILNNLGGASAAALASEATTARTNEAANASAAGAASAAAASASTTASAASTTAAAASATATAAAATAASAHLTNVAGVLSQNAGGTSFALGQLPHFSACLAQVRNGTGPGCYVLDKGDSTDYGHGATALSGSGPQLNEGDFVSLLLNQAGIPANNNSFCGNGSIHPQTATSVRGGGFDNRISAGTNWISGAQPTIGGDLITAVTAGGTPFVFQPDTSYNAAAATLYPAMQPNTFNIIYYNISSRGAMTAQATGGSLVTISGTGSGALATATATAASASASNTLTINNTTTGSTPANFTCILATNSAVPSVNIINAGEPGGLLAEWNTTIPVYGYVATQTYIAPALVIIKPGINDAGVTTPTNFQALLDAEILQDQAEGSDVIVESPNPIGSPGGVPAALTALVATEAAEAALRNVPYVDNYDALGSYAATSALNENFDLVHPNSLLYARMAAPVARVMMAQ